VFGIVFYFLISITVTGALETTIAQNYYSKATLTLRAPNYVVNSYTELVELMAQVFEHRETEFAVDFSYIPNNVSDEIRNALAEMKRIVPYDYWHYKRARWSYSSNSATISLTYKTTFTQEEELEDALLPIISPWFNLSTYEKIKAVHDWIVNNLEYDTSYSRYTAYEAFFDKSAVCEGYSLLTYKMFSLLNVDVSLISGTADGGDHMWNMVKLCCAEDCKWFHLDVTWDDPLPGGMLKYNYFLLSDEEISQDHTISENFGISAPVNFDQWQSACSLLVPLPSGKNVFNYQVARTTKRDRLPAKCKPMGLRVNNGVLTLLVDLPTFAESMDFYLGIYAPAINANDIILIINNGQELNWLSNGLKAWLSNSVGNINQSVSLYIKPEDLPQGRYYFYLLAVPANDISLTNYYLWSTTYIQDQ